MVYVPPYPSAADSLPEPPPFKEALRPLSPYERLFWAIDRVNGFNFSLAVTFRGTASHADWIAAFAQAQERHPLLSACIDHVDPHVPVFIRSAANLPIPLKFGRRTSTTEWQRVMEREQAKPFDAATAPFLRATLLEDSEGCDLIVTANHVVLDGVGAVAFVRDLLAALAGEKLAPLPLAPSADDRTAHARSTAAQSAADSTRIPQVDGGWQQTVDALPARTFTRHIGTGGPAVDALRFSREQTDQLIRCCRLQQATVGAVLVAAVASSLRTLSPPLKNGDIRMNVPIDARPYLDNAADFVLSVIGARFIAPNPAKCLWESARAIRAELAPWQSFVEIESTFNRVKAMMAMNLDSTTLIDIMGSKFGHDVIVTNLKHVQFDSLPGGLTVEGVWGPSVLMGYEGEHTLGTATYDGALHLVYTSHTPVAGLLKRLQAKIAMACAEAEATSGLPAMEKVAAWMANGKRASGLRPIGDSI
jgi:hypothetical protein